MLAPCPCGSGRPLAACCGPYLDGAEPPDAPSLMRSRYTAFVLGRHDHLARTLHPDHEDRRIPSRELKDRFARHFKRARYHGLVVLDHDGPDARGVHRVLFRVSMKLAGQDASFAEVSRFESDGAGLRYRSGKLLDPRALERAGATTLELVDALFEP